MEPTWNQLGSPWIPLDPLGSPWIPLDPSGILWIPLDLLHPIGYQWILLAPDSMLFMDTPFRLTRAMLEMALSFLKRWRRRPLRQAATRFLHPGGPDSRSDENSACDHNFVDSKVSTQVEMCCIKLEPEHIFTTKVIWFYMT